MYAKQDARDGGYVYTSITVTNQMKYPCSPKKQGGSGFVMES